MAGPERGIRSAPARGSSLPPGTRVPAMNGSNLRPGSRIESNRARERVVVRPRPTTAPRGRAERGIRTRRSDGAANRCTRERRMTGVRPGEERAYLRHRARERNALLQPDDVIETARTDLGSLFGGAAAAGQFGESATNRQVEMRDRQFVQPASCCVNTTAYFSPSGATLDQCGESGRTTRRPCVIVNILSRCSRPVRAAKFALPVHGMVEIGLIEKYGSVPYRSCLARMVLDLS